MLKLLLLQTRRGLFQRAFGTSIPRRSWENYFPDISSYKTYNKEPGRITDQDLSIYVNNCNFFDLTLPENVNGAALCVSENVLVESSAFTNCSTGEGNVVGGGAIYFKGDRLVIVNSCGYKCYSNGGFGGDFLLSFYGKMVESYSSSYIANDPGKEYEALYICGSGVKIEGGNFSENSGNFASALLIDTPVDEVHYAKYCEFHNNKVKKNGVIYLYAGSFEVEYSSFQGNEMEGDSCIFYKAKFTEAFTVRSCNIFQSDKIKNEDVNILQCYCLNQAFCEYSDPIILSIDTVSNNKCLTKSDSDQPELPSAPPAITPNRTINLKTINAFPFQGSSRKKRFMFLL